MIGFILGLTVMYLYFQPKLTYQGKSVKDWAIIANQNHNEAVTNERQLASVSAALQTFLNAPTPTPEIKYVAQPKPAVKCQVVANAYTHFTMCCDAEGSCTSSN